ncbi:MAG: glycosyltransferase family 39 protein [Flexilinea flocculi]|nr:glycosyltransferase family 39 protein [Flexilinea flocculi]
MKKTVNSLSKWIPILFFILLFCAAWILHDDYGGFTDELLHIQTAEVNYKYVLSKFLPEDKIPDVPIYDLDTIPDLYNYVNQYYGEAVMMPTILVSILPGVNFSTADFLNFRRFYTFLNFFITLISFYFLMKFRFSNQQIAFVSVLFLVFSPRLFAESFYNSKDIIFFCWFFISIFGIGLFLLQNNCWGLIIFAIALGFSVNTRIYGIVLLPAFLYLSIVDHFINHRSSKRRLFYIFLTILFALLFYLIITPFLWENPFQQFLNAINFSSQQVGIDPNNLNQLEKEVTLGNQELFFNDYIFPGKTWYYIPAWIGLTIPVINILFFFLGIIYFLRQSFQIKNVFSMNSNYLFDGFCLLLFFISLISIIISRATMYHGWRQSYFLYAPFIITNALGFAHLWNQQLNTKKQWVIKNSILLLTCLISFLSTGFWMIKNHPFDFVYFNEIGRYFAQQFTRDYWGVASKSCIQEVDRHYIDGDPIRLGVNADLTYGSAQNSLLRFPEETQAHFQVIWKNENADYLCFSYKNIPGNSHPIPGFEIIKTFQVDGYDVAAVYRRIEKNLP